MMNFVRHFLILALSLVPATIAAPASAAIITYSLNGSGSADIGGTFYSGDFELIASGDTDDSFLFAPGINIFPLSTITLKFGSTEIQGLDGTAFFTNNAVNFYGFNYRYLGEIAQVIGFRFDTATPFDGVSDFGPVATTFAGPPPFAVRPYLTSAGSMTTRTATLTSFSASLAPAAVPEPGAWAMMIAGFGMVGAVMRRRSRVVMSYG